MHRVGRWLTSRTPSSTSTHLDSVAEAQNMEIALKAAELILDDDINGAEERLSHGSSAFHKLSQGTLGFMKATLGFEPEIMRQATETLADAENTAYQYHQKAQHDPQAFSSTIYEKGSEFALCQAEAQIMAAVVGVLNESITESLKGFYKMRKAYFTLDNLAQQEQAFMKARGIRGAPLSRQASSNSVRSVHSYRGEPPPNLTMGTLAPNAGPPIVARPTTHVHPSTLRSATSVNDLDNEKETKGLKSSHDSDDDSDDFYEAENTHEKPLGHQGHSEQLGGLTPIVEKTQRLGISRDASYGPSGAKTPLSGTTTPNYPLLDPNQPSLLTADADSDIFSNSLDVFIHSGVNLMSGMINLMLSVIPPAFGRLLSIVGFRGDRERGLRMLWQASKFQNINGGMAALILLSWYNGVSSFCDIISDSDPNLPNDVNGFPIERLTVLLNTMRARYPKSYLWKLGEAGMYANRRDSQKAIELLHNSGEKAQLKQLEALAMFELSLATMNVHDYLTCAKSFIACIDLNEWSPALYHYAAAAAYLQIYRDNHGQPGKEATATQYRDLALKHFKEAPTHVGKKKMMGKQLPFDTFVTRKVAKWTARASSWNVDFIEAIGVSPIEEITLLWNGYKKMNHAQLETSLINLAWSEDPSKNPHWAREDMDEKAIHALLKASILRNLRRHDEAVTTLETGILNHDANVFRGHLKDDWVAPSANYEMAANLWMQRREYIRRYGSTLAGLEADIGKVPLDSDLKHDASVVAEAKKFVEKAKNWGAYELDTRIGMKITAGYAAIGKWEAKHKDLVK